MRGSGAAGEDAKPRDHLEKIFQIPFWLEPLDAVAPLPPPPPPAPRDLQPPGLEITEDELAAMDELAPLLGRSRASEHLSADQGARRDPVAFLREAEPIAPYRATLLLLALAAGQPTSAGAFLDAVLRGDEGPEDVPSPWPVELPWLKPAAEEVVRFTFHWHQSMYS